MIDLGNANNTRYYSIADDASLTLPNGDWCVGIWTRADDNTGTNFQYIASNNNFSAANSLNLYLSEATEASNPDGWNAVLEDAAVNNVVINTDSIAPGGDGQTRLIVLQRNSTVVQLFQCVQNATAALSGSASVGSLGAINGGAWNIGRRVDGNVDRYWEEHFGGFFKGDFALSTEEITAIGHGITPMRLGKSCDAYLEFKEQVATVSDIVAANDATRNGTGLATSEHFPVFMTMIGHNAAAVAASGRIMSSLAAAGGLAGRGGIAGQGGGLAG